MAKIKILKTANPEISGMAKTGISLKKRIELVGLGYWAGFISGGIALAIWATISGVCR